MTFDIIIGLVLTSIALSAVVFLTFEGFEVIAQTGDEAIEPRRNLPKAMIYSKHKETRTEDEIVALQEEPIPIKGVMRA